MTAGNGRNSMETLEEVASTYSHSFGETTNGRAGIEATDTIRTYHNELVQQQTQISDQIRQVQATGVQLIGQLNQVAGAIAAVEKIMADQAK